jgi:multidrug efflux pump subunit AcrB
MSLVRLAFRNPYLIVALTAGLCLLGGAVLPRIPADILPDFKKPVIASFFSYPGLPTMVPPSSRSSSKPGPTLPRR